MMSFYGNWIGTVTNVNVFVPHAGLAFVYVQSLLDTTCITPGRKQDHFMKQHRSKSSLQGKTVQLH